MKKIALVGLFAAMVPVSLFAHPGHGETDGFTITHYFTEPIHAITTIGALVVAIVYIRLQRNKQKTRV